MGDHCRTWDRPPDAEERWAMPSLTWLPGGLPAKNPESTRNCAVISTTSPERMLSPEKLDQLTHQAFRNAGRFYFDFYHLVQGPMKRAQNQVHIPEDVYEKITSVQQSGRGVVLAGMHTGNFDLGMVALAADRLEITALSASNPKRGLSGFRTSCAVRSGLELLPITPGSLKKADQTAAGRRDRRNRRGLASP